MTKIKICGLYRSEDIRYVNQVKPDWCGFIINFPKSHRSLAPEKVRSLRRELDDAVVPVGVFVNQPVDTVVALLNDGTVSIAQLHGQEDAAYIAALRAAAPGHPVWKAYALVVDKVNPGLTDLFLKQARKVLQAPEKGSVLEKLKQEPPERKPAAPKKREPER